MHEGRSNSLTQGSIDLIPYELRAEMLAVNVPEQLIIYTSSSDDFSGTCLVMTRRFVEQKADVCRATNE